MKWTGSIPSEKLTDFRSTDTEGSDQFQAPQVFLRQFSILMCMKGLLICTTYLLPFLFFYANKQDLSFITECKHDHLLNRQRKCSFKLLMFEAQTAQGATDTVLQRNY
uniref:Uncharacterized protein n=1 Tax=Micrurus corallinus TaxID=54390 RepID=A0A2D4GUL4_MICCO